ncbi:regulator of volume decrease after cellular swelling-domain-containing protein [Phlebopus sp. FC_14]|nr:regulator of volume decrease after cellular swelling-domain-containing protein [Phlebopus sp. FC_14]
MVSTTIITAVPASVTPEEHRNIIASTPSSFNDIPPVLRNKQEHVSVSLDPPLDEFTVEDSSDGVLYVIESALVFMSSSGRGLRVPYPAITLHAISRAEGSSPSIYCQLDEEVTGAAPADDSAEDVREMRELSIIPQDPMSLESIFEAMSYCASLHPDPSLSEDDDGDDVFVSSDHFETFIGEQDEELSEVGRVRSDFVNSNRYTPY